jgi:hypothetical protein
MILPGFKILCGAVSHFGFASLSKRQVRKTYGIFPFSFDDAAVIESPELCRIPLVQ